MIRFFADYLLLIILAVSAVAIFWELRDKKQWAKLPIVIMAGLTSLLVAKLASIAYQPASERPFITQGVEAGAAFIDNPGFPSDHALLAVAAIGAVWFMTWNRRLLTGLVIAAIVMMIARVLALVHTPLDIIGGVIAGLIGFLWYMTSPKHK